MRVTVKLAVIDRETCAIIEAGTTVDVSEEVAADWVRRGIATVAPAPPPPPQPPQQPKGKR